MDPKIFTFEEIKAWLDSQLAPFGYVATDAWETNRFGWMIRKKGWWHFLEEDLAMIRGSLLQIIIVKNSDQNHPVIRELAKAVKEKFLCEPRIIIESFDHCT